MGIRLRRIGEPHQQRELYPVGEDMKRVVEGLVGFVVVVRRGNVVDLGLCWPIAVRILLGRGWEELVSDAHLDVVGLAGKHRQRLVLGLAAKAGNCPVNAGISLGVGQNLRSFSHGRS
jgi:hypothetical protein